MPPTEYKKMLKNLVSFDFPSSREATEKASSSGGINLKHYQRYFKN